MARPSPTAQGDLESIATADSEPAASIASAAAEELWARLGREAATCCVCLRLPADAVASPCGHLAACHRCLESLRTRELGQCACPICRNPVDLVRRVARPEPCQMCRNVQADTLSIPCGHWYNCEECMSTTQRHPSSPPQACHVCNEPVTKFLKVFR